jgi:hypothetical protein
MSIRVLIRASIIPHYVIGLTQNMRMNFIRITDTTVTRCLSMFVVESVSGAAASA